ncbi:MAG: hypothetical protein ACPGXK_03610, partial [Phycisphaerae bacterium]
RVIRGGATIMHGNALACLIVAISLMASGSIEWVEPVISYGLRAFLVILGIEFAMNFVLDFYRRRVLRILPAFVVCMGVTSLLSAMFVPDGWLSAPTDRVR